jgi:hypothetical protein
MRNCFALLLGLGLTTSLVACSSSDNKGGGGNNLNSDGGGSGGGGATTPGFNAATVKELEATNVGKYIGVNTPTSNSTTAGITSYEYDAKGGAGPVCLWGDSYRVLVRDASSDNLLIYLEGGGACWTGFCAANTQADVTKSFGATGILDNQATTNALATWNVVYVPYCDGSVFSGDNDVPNPTPAAGETTTRHQRGLRNLTAGIDLAKAQFPNAKRIVLAGSSAGGYGTLTGTGLVRLEYPTTPLIVFNDAGLGLSNPTDPTMFATLQTDWQFEQFVPPSCTECAGGHLTQLIAWGLKNDPTLRVAGFSSYNDGVIGGVFLKMAGPDFKALLLQQTGLVHDAYPTRFERFFIDGAGHTTLIANTATPGGGGYNTPIEGESVATWTRDFVDGNADWKDHLESADGG